MGMGRERGMKSGRERERERGRGRTRRGHWVCTDLVSHCLSVDGLLLGDGGLPHLGGSSPRRALRGLQLPLLGGLHGPLETDLVELRSILGGTGRRCLAPHTKRAEDGLTLTLQLALLRDEPVELRLGYVRVGVEGQEPVVTGSSSHGHSAVEGLHHHGELFVLGREGGLGGELGEGLLAGGGRLEGGLDVRVDGAVHGLLQATEQRARKLVYGGRLKRDGGAPRGKEEGRGDERHARDSRDGEDLRGERGMRVDQGDALDEGGRGEGWVGFRQSG